MKIDDKTINMTIRKNSRNTQNVSIDVLDTEDDVNIDFFVKTNMNFLVVNNWALSDHIYLEGMYIDTDYTQVDNYYFKRIAHMNNMIK
tara:strand:- start:506 stop:769 length:264 start_codon:yes stop_codon:yes gene_type:complete